MNKLFPEYLNKGSKGPACVVLQLLLVALNLNDNIVPDGDYGEQTAIGVRRFQTQNNLEEDGNFGPATRRTFLVVTGIDVNALDAELFIGETVTPELAAAAAAPVNQEKISTQEM